MSERKFHKVVELFPKMTEKDFDELKKDIVEKGLLQPIYLDPDGKIIDGRHRYLACKELGVEPKYAEWNGKGSLVEFVLSLNLKRRHLSPSQSAMVGQEALKQIKKEVADSKSEKLKGQEEESLSEATTSEAAPSGKTETEAETKAEVKGGDAKSEDAEEVSAEEVRSRDKAGKLVGTSGKLIDSADVVKNHGVEELQDAIWDKGASVTAAAVVAKNYSPEEQRDIAKKGKKAISQAAKKAKEAKKAEKEAKKVVAPEDKPATTTAANGDALLNPLSYNQISEEIFGLLDGCSYEVVENIIEELQDFVEVLKTMPEKSEVPEVKQETDKTQPEASSVDYKATEANNESDTKLQTAVNA